jgi:predicted dinucleotide-binding enzyme
MAGRRRPAAYTILAAYLMGATSGDFEQEQSRLAAQLQRAIVSTVPYRLEEETAQRLFEDCQEIVTSIAVLIERRLDAAIGHLQDAGYIPI